MEGRVAWKNDLAHSLLIWSIGAHTNHQLEDNLDVTLVYKERDHATRIVSVFFGQQGLRRVWWFLVAVLQPSLESWGSKISVFFIWSYYYTFIWWLYWSGIDWNRIFIISIDQWSVMPWILVAGQTIGGWCAIHAKRIERDWKQILIHCLHIISTWNSMSLADGLYIQT